jgi:hypothetical protein
LIQEKELFSPGLDAEGLKTRHLVGDRVSRPDYGPFTLFVQSTGLGTRHLKGGTKILYQVIYIVSANSSDNSKIIKIDRKKIIRGRGSNSGL